MKKGLSTALVFIMVSSSVMPAYADGIGLNLSENNSFSNEYSSEETIFEEAEGADQETGAEPGGTEESQEETGEESGKTEESPEGSGEETKETEENQEETGKESEEAEENPVETEEEPEEPESGLEETEEESDATGEGQEEPEEESEATEEDQEETEEGSEETGESQGETGEEPGETEETEEAAEKTDEDNIEESETAAEAPVEGAEKKLENAELLAVQLKSIELEGEYADGTYTGSGGGYKGTITLKVTIADNQITDIQEVSQSETADRWEKAKKLFDEIINTNSTDVDAISSATRSSEGILEAVEDALSKAAVSDEQVFEDGNGSKKDPYIIADDLQLERFAGKINEGNDYKGKYIELSNDLELSGEWIPAGTKEEPFAGFFSGKGYTINGLSIQDQTVKYAGLFGYLAAGAKVSDVKLEDVNISRDAEASEAGAVAGSTDAGVFIDNCEVSGSVEAGNLTEINYAGGIVGKLGSSSVVSNVYADVSVAAVSESKGAYAGGITGLSGNKCILINGASFGSVSAQTDADTIAAAGGLFGSWSGTAYNVFNDCQVTAESGGQSKALAGGICGMATKNTAIINGYFNSSIPNALMTATSAITGYITENVEGLPDSELNDSDMVDTLNRGLTRSKRAEAIARISEAGNQNMGDLQNGFDSVDAVYAWEFSGRVTLSGEAFVDDSIDTGIFEGGSGTEEDPYLLKTEEQLRTFAKSLSEEVTYSGIYIALDEDIDVSGETWLPIGLGHYDFKGIFDGNGHKITGIRIGSEDVPYEEESGDSENTGKMTTFYGLFGVVGENAVIKNLSIEDSVISVKRSTNVYAGLLAGVTDRAYIDSCHAAGYVFAETTHSKANAWAGGLVGQTIKGGIINSWTDAEVYCTAVGGLAESGAFIGMTNRSVVASCFALGNAGGKASREDGNEGMPAVSSFIGVNGGKVANCYAVGDMTADSFSTYVGSFSGWSTGIARQFISYYNADAVQNSNGTINRPVISVGFMVSAGVNDEGEAYDGTYHVGIEAKEQSFMESQEFADLLNSNYNAFPLDIENGESSNVGNQNAMGLPEFMKLKEWQLEDGIVMPSGETVSTTYKDMTPEFEPDTLDMADGTYYGRAKGLGGEYIYVSVSVAEARISDIRITKHSEGSQLDSISAEIIASVIETQNYSQSGSDSELQKALKSAIAVGAQKASIRDLTGYGYVSDSVFAAGKGTKENPYIINTAEQLVAFAGSLNEDEHYAGKFVKLGENISLNGIEWIPAGGSGAYGFRGTFDGNNKVISHMTVGSSENPEIYCKSVGLFANLEAARIKNLGIENASIHHKYLGDSIAYAGILSGYYIENAGDGGYVDFCYATGTVNSYSAKQNDSAGLIGAINKGIIANCYVEIDIRSESRDGYAYAGGISALPNRALIINNYASGNIKGSGNGARIQIGGISGMNAGVAVNNFADVDLVSANTTVDVGGFSGRVSGIAYVEKAYYNNEAQQISGSRVILPARGVGTVVSGANYGKGTVVDLEGKTLSELNQPEFAKILNENKADAKVLERANGILKELGYEMSSEIILRDFQYSSDEGGVVFRDRVTGNGDGGSSGENPSGENPSGGNPSNGNPSNSDSSDDDYDAGTGLRSSAGLEDQPVQGNITVTANRGENGSAGVSISDQTIAEAIARAQSDARVQGKAANGISIEVNIALPKDARSLTAAFSRNALESLVSANVQNLDINGTLIRIALNKKAVEEICRQSGDDVTISVEPVEVSGVSSCYDITIHSVKEEGAITVTSLNEGSTVIGIPFTPENNETEGFLCGVYVDENGGISPIADSVYDRHSRQILFRTNHFSIYGVGNTALIPAFTDTADHWAGESIDYAAARGLLEGTSDSVFDPEAVLTKGMLMTALGKLSGADVSSYEGITGGSGSDTMLYMEWARQNGIIQGDNHDLSGVDGAVTREEMAVIMQNYARATGFSLPVTRSAVSFADDGNSDGEAKPAVMAMQKAGLMRGERDGKFNPKGNTTRAQAAAILERYVKLTVDSGAAEGWEKNDAGQYLYYKNGLAVTGTQNIDGTVYHFSAEGILQESGEK
ncbi:S-layer homology domain-containing protein [Lachnospiraceae bacterium 54-53]